MSKKMCYSKHCLVEKSIPIFSQHWWLDAVCGEGKWDVCIAEKNGNIIGTMPYYMSERRGMMFLSQPQLTQTLGPWIRNTGLKPAKVLAHEKKVMQLLIDQLPSFDDFNQNWHHSNTNWLPFYWHGFEQVGRYTYILSDLSNSEALWANLEGNIRREIKKAEGRFALDVRDDLGLDAFLALNRKTFERQGKALPYSEDLVRKIDAACSQRDCRKMWIAIDSEGKHHAGVYIVWDENSAYYLMGGGDPDLRSSGATSLCMWKAISHASTVTKSFDFEGSMIEPVERFFRAFGAVQTPFFNIRKTPSRLVRIRHCLRTIMNGG